jgi:membrane protease YdiL (CAAX protease family)
VTDRPADAAPDGPDETAPTGAGEEPTDRTDEGGGSAWAPYAAAPLDRRVLRAEMWLVLWISIAASALRSFLSLLNSLTREQPLSSQTATIVATFVDDRPWLDVMYQATRISLGLIPVLLVIHLLRRSGEGPRVIGFDLRDWRRDLWRGALLAAGVGGVGLVFYLTAFQLGMNVRIAAADIQDSWWNLVLLLVSAAYNSVLEEVIVLGYFLHRARQIGWRPWQAIAGSALMRGAYHLYQGFGGFLGNLAMGALFGWLYLRWRRVMPFVVAHFLIDAVAFIGYDLLSGTVSWLP